MNYIEMKSDNFDRVGYDPVNLTLEVLFARSGKTYQYIEVPFNTMVNFIFAKSQGSYFSLYIAKEFKYEEIN